MDIGKRKDSVFDRLAWQTKQMLTLNGIPSKLGETDITSFIQLIMYALIAVPETQRCSVPPKFLMKGFRSKVFLHDPLHFGVRQRSLKLIFH